MVTILLEQIIEILKGWLSSFTSWAEDTAEKLGLIEEATEYIDDIYDETTQIQTNTSSIVTSNNMIQGYSFNISNKTNNIDNNVTAIKNNVGSIATSSGVTAAFAEDCATNGLNILDKVTTIASDTTQMRADNVVVKSDLDKIYDAVKWSLVSIDTTETEEGVGSLSFDTDKTDLLNQFAIAFTAVQSGSGDPAPNNVRQITGWTDFDITANDSILNIDLGGTYYKGFVNAISGKITNNRDKKKLSDYNWIKGNVNTAGTGRIWRCNFSSFTVTPDDYTLCDSFKRVSWGLWESLAKYEFMCTENNDNFVFCVEDDYTDANAMLAVYGNVEFTVKLKNPIEAQASNTLSINTKKGLNTITSDSNGTMTVTYTESVKHYLDKQEG